MEPAIKADAYGHGAVPVALDLEAAGADGFSVATFDEAVELREAGVRAPLLVLFPIPPAPCAAAFASGIAQSVGPCVTAGRILAAAAEVAAHRRGGAPLEVQVEVDTGLGRGGVLPEAVRSTIQRVQAAPGVRLGGVWTHLAAAEDPPHARRQDERFAAALRDAGEAVAWGPGPSQVRRHLAGSGGILGGGVTAWDAIRPGISLFGLLPEGVTPSARAEGPIARIRPVLALKARPVRVVELPAGHGISYGPSHVISGPRRIATLPLGYEDGWRRALTDRAEALVRGVRVPLVGRVALDAVMADVTDVPGEAVTVDDEFVLNGEQGSERITADELASVCGTISHEIVTGMSRRVARVYHAAGSVTGARTLAGWRS